MPSHALRHWQTRSRKVLDEFEAAHAQLGGSSSRRFARQQIAQAYVVAWCSQFQRYCRDLHSEATDYLARHPAFLPLAPVLQSSLNTNRRLDTGNANSTNIDADFSRFGFPFWMRMHQHDPRNVVRQQRLDALNRWRNAVAHQDFRHRALGGRETIRIAEVRAWRRTCAALAVDFDRALGLYLQSITGVRPW